MKWAPLEEWWMDEPPVHLFTVPSKPPLHWAFLSSSGLVAWAEVAASGKFKPCWGTLHPCQQQYVSGNQLQGNTGGSCFLVCFVDFPEEANGPMDSAWSNRAFLVLNVLIFMYLASLSLAIVQPIFDTLCAYCIVGISLVFALYEEKKQDRMFWSFFWKRDMSFSQGQDYLSG